MRALKIAGIVFGSLIALVVIAVGLLLLIIDPNDYKPQLAALVKDKTDMTLAIDDRLEWTLWPSIGVKLGRTSLSDAEKKETLVAVGKAAVSVELMPLFSKQINIDAVTLEGARVRFIQYADGSTSWDRMLAKLASAPEEEKSDAVNFNVKEFDVRDSSVYLKDEKAGVERAVEDFKVSARDISLDSAFPLTMGFVFRQQDAAGKTLVAQNTLEATVSLQQEKKLYQLLKLKLSSALSGTALPAPANVALEGDVRADLAANQVSVAGLKLKADYQDKALKSPATVQLAAEVLADLGQTRLTLDKLTVNASWPDAARPAALSAALAGQVATNWSTGELDIPQFTVNAVVPDQAYPKPLQVSLNAPLKGNWKEMNFELPGFVATAAGVKAEGRLAASLPALKAPAPEAAETSVAAAATATPAAQASPGKPVTVPAATAGKATAMPVAAPSAPAKATADPAAPVKPVTAGMTLNGKLNVAPFNPRALMAALGIAAPKTADANVLKRASLDTLIEGDEKKVLLKNLRIVLDDSTVTGEAGISDLASLRQYARLTLDRMDVDRYLAPASTASTAPAAEAPAAAPAKAAPAGDLLPVDLIRQQNLDVALSAGSLKLLTYPVSNFRVAATAGNGVVNVSEFKGSIFQGGFSAPLSINVQGAQPVLSLKPSLNGVEIGPLAQKLLKKDLLTGRANFNGAFTVRGNSTDAFMKTVTGNADLKFDNGVLRGVNAMKELTAALGKYQGLVAMATGKDLAAEADKQNDTQIASFSANNTLKDGVVNSTALNADLRRAKVAGSGTFNLVSQALDYRFNLNLDKSVAGDRYAAYALPVACKGSLAGNLASLCKLDSKAVQDMALKAAAAKGLEKLGLKGETPKEAVQLKVEEEKAKAQEKAKEKVNEELQKGLQKLFNR
ncbi:MAG: AsmA family protein [Pseudomonadota bacterium]